MGSRPFGKNPNRSRFFVRIASLSVPVFVVVSVIVVVVVVVVVTVVIVVIVVVVVAVVDAVSGVPFQHKAVILQFLENVGDCCSVPVDVGVAVVIDAGVAVEGDVARVKDALIRHRSVYGVKPEPRGRRFHSSLSQGMLGQSG